MTARMPDLRGHHLNLRELRPTDHEVYERIFTHPLLTRYLGVDRMSRKAAQDAFARALGQPYDLPRTRYSLAVTAPGDDAMVGTVGLLVEGYGSNAMITGLVLLPGAPVTGHGHEAGRLLMAYAFGRLGLHRVWAGHRADHTRMGAVMEAAGLRPEARVRQLFRTRDTWHDVTTYSALAPEWLGQATRAERAVAAGTDLGGLTLAT